mmetsp:Transcript_6253/g.21466  ORF Transcript_6253/g.21466 Transcript_6253/m.21466 type:complete len:249 (+) Transcript_6253:192-938(+)
MADAPIPKTSKELSNAIYDDHLRNAIDAAKKRAVKQGCDYDTFKNMVSVAHLKPLQAKDERVFDGKMQPAWNFKADGTLAKDEVHKEFEAVAPTAPPKTPQEFERDWKRNCPTDADKYRYLRAFPAGLPQEIFKVEVGAGKLGEIIAVLDSFWLLGAAEAQEKEVEGGALSEAAFVMGLLGDLAGSGRFSLTSRLLGGAHKQAATSLFEQLGVASGALGAMTAENAGSLGGVLSEEKLAELKKSYGVK